MYTGDSFFTLSPLGQAGLIGLSLCLTSLVLLVARRMSRNRAWPMRLAIAFVVIWAFEWLSPQVYYLYYIFLFDLPLQLVVQTPPTPGDVVRLLTFTAGFDLSHHGRGALSWLILLACVAPHRQSQRAQVQTG